MLLAMNVHAYLILCFVCATACNATGCLNERQTSRECISPAMGGVKWILSVMEPNYGWGENTHRAIIALRVNEYQDPETPKMELQLENVLTNELLKNNSSPIHKNDLALFIHALIACKKNPRNFHGIDLVADLLHRVNSDGNVHPYLVLTLCNAHAVEFGHLEKIKHHTREGNSTQVRETEMKALTLKAMACAASLPDAHSRKLDKFGNEMEEAAKSLLCRQVNGVFGDVFTTSLAVQALTASGKEFDEEKALNFLRKESDVNVNMVKTYYIEVGLNARRVKFIKDLYDGPYDPEQQVAVPEIYTKFTIREELRPHEEFSVVMKIPRNWNLFQVMEQAAKLSHRYRFSYVLNQDEEPIVFQVNQTPNDPEKDMYWQICRQTHNKDTRSSDITTFHASPAKLQPLDGETIILWYGSTGCPGT